MISHRWKMITEEFIETNINWYLQELQEEYDISRILKM